MTGLSAGVIGSLRSDHFIDISATTYTVKASDFGKVLRFTAATAVAVTVPNGLPSGFNCLWRVIGTGQVTFTAGAGTVLRNADGGNKSIGQYAQGSIARDLSGDIYLGGSLTV